MSSNISPRIVKQVVRTGVSFTCDGQDTYWFYNKFPLPIGAAPQLNPNILEINSLRVDHAGDYYCFNSGYDSASSVLSKTSLIVIGKC